MVCKLRSKTKCAKHFKVQNYVQKTKQQKKRETNQCNKFYKKRINEKGLWLLKIKFKIKTIKKNLKQNLGKLE